MKNKILDILIVNCEAYVSGETLSESLGVSRTAIWKNINALRNEGYKIDSITNKGYRLISETSDITSISLKSMIQPYAFLKFANHYDSIDSTNQEAKRLAMDNDHSEGLIVASEQISGKGRLGRQWTSEKNSGLWTSLLLRPDVNPESASRITLVAATAMCEALEKVTGLTVGIKWPNDLVVNGKKVCGILTEMSAELNHLHYIILGIGVNIKQTNFSEDLKDKATSLILEGCITTPKPLLIEFLISFSKYYDQFVSGNMAEVIKHHRAHSATLQRDVILSSYNETRCVFAQDIDEEGCLIIKNEAGQLEKIFSGEVSVRGINGYV